MVMEKYYGNHIVGDNRVFLDIWILLLINIAFNKVLNKVLMNKENEMNGKSTYPFV